MLLCGIAAEQVRVERRLFAFLSATNALTKWEMKLRRNQYDGPSCVRWILVGAKNCQWTLVRRVVQRIVNCLIGGKMSNGRLRKLCSTDHKLEKSER